MFQETRRLASVLGDQFVISKFNSLILSMTFLLSLPTLALSDSNNQSSMCSVLLSGVENGSVELEFFETVCSFVSERQRVLDAVFLGDLKTLENLEINQEQSAALHEAFSDAESARSFFEKTRNQDTSRFLTSAFNAGFNPNLLVGLPGRNQTSLLYYALKASNFDAAKTMLNHGASPHVYDALWGEEYYRKYLLDPLQWVETLSATEIEKADLVLSMYEAGMVWPTSGAFGSRERSVYGVEEVEAKIAASYQILGKPQPEEITPKPLAICKRAPPNDQINWCTQLAKISARYYDPDGGGGVNVVRLGRLMAIYEDYFFFLANVTSGYTYDSPVGVAKVSLSGDRVRLFFFSPNSGGLGHCSRLRDRSDGKDPGGYIDSDRNAYCWRSYTLRREFGNKTYKNPYDWPMEASGSVLEEQSQ